MINKEVFHKLYCKQSSKCFVIVTQEAFYSVFTGNCGKKMGNNTAV